jgi:hypothetical protein
MVVRRLASHLMANAVATMIAIETTMATDVMTATGMKIIVAIPGHLTGLRRERAIRQPRPLLIPQQHPRPAPIPLRQHKLAEVVGAITAAGVRPLTEATRTAVPTER